MDKRCLIISYYFPPVGGAGVQRILKMIKYLSRHQWKFTVISAAVDDELQPLDQTLLNELPDQLKVIRISSDLPLKKLSILQKVKFFEKSSFWKRWLIAFRYIPDMRKIWLSQARETVMAELYEKDYNCVLITIPPYSLATLAVDLQEKTDIPVIMDMRDPWSLHPYKIHPTIYHLKKDRAIEFESVNKIKFGVSAYAKLLNYYEKNLPEFNREKWKFIPNGYDEEDYLNLDRELESLPNNSFNIGFSGTIHSSMNSPVYLLKSIAKLRDSGLLINRQVVFHHIGKSAISLQKLAKKYKLESQIIQWDYVDHRRCLSILNSMDALCLIHNIQNDENDMIIGGKVYEYLRLKKPILALVPEDGEAAELINKTNSGKVISPNNTDQICETLEQWINGNADFEFMGIEAYSREEQARQFLDVLNRACGMDQN